MSVEKKYFYEVAVPAKFDRLLTYHSDFPIERGSSVEVSLGRRKLTGVIYSEVPQPEEFETKPISQLAEERPRLSAERLNWIKWLSDYYFWPMGLVADLCFPSLPKKGRKTLENWNEENPPPAQTLRHKQPELTKEQACVVNELSVEPGFQPHLIRGVTGSGKTEVYLQLLHKIVERGDAGLVLVPEISLTPQLLDRFQERFGDQVACLHSQLTDREKTNHWWSMVDGKKKILIGARSALFCPIPKLGIIVIDEEHEASFKQDTQLRYQARDAAVFLARSLDIPIVLGSATPSLESWQNTLSGKYKLHSMLHRVSDRNLPQVEVVNLKDQENRDPSWPSWITLRLKEEIEKTLELGEQSALFINRRGVAQALLCESCAGVVECPNCAISLTLHGQSYLVCHYCDYSERLPEKCPHCREGVLKSFGLGTEAVEADLQELFPNARILRADRDEIQNRKELMDFIRKVEKREVDILVGTQMIAKGLDFPSLTLVGLLMADVGFHLPDFRATERSFQLLAQMAGRSGRHSPGRVILQTYDPSHLSVVTAQTHDFLTFAEEELKNRVDSGYPPFGRLCLVRLSSKQIETLQTFGQKLKERARLALERTELSDQVQLLGPTPAPIAKLRNEYRFQALVKSRNPQALQRFLKVLLGDSTWIPKKVKFQFDVDPVNMM